MKRILLRCLGAAAVAIAAPFAISATDQQKTASDMPPPTPWIPFAPINDKILLKYFKINPVTGDVVLLMKAAKGEGAHIHRHTGTVMVYTLSGRWEYDQHGWVAQAGDFVFEPSESSHSFTNLSDDDNGMALVVSTGELHFLDEDGKVTFVETWRTALSRYQDYCKANELPEIDLIGCQGGR